MVPHYRDKIAALQRIFGEMDLALEPDVLRVGSRRYPIVEDVIILSESAGAPDIQFTFGEEWKEYARILPDHRAEFDRYFDLVDPATLKDGRVCDLGCGIGRWSFFLKDRVRELVLVDFSDAIFVARRNLAGAPNALFFKGDLQRLPFAPDFCDFLMCLGVLHHLPAPCLDAVRALKRYAPRLLIYLYYALDNRPAFFRLLLSLVTRVRGRLSRLRSPSVRRGLARLGAAGVYRPLVLLGRLLQPLGLARFVPLYEFYRGKSLRRMEQDVYDRFFTGIEQRVTRQEILGLQDVFSRITVSDGLPYWRFLAAR